MAISDYSNQGSGSGSGWDGASGRGECDGCTPLPAQDASSSDEIRAARLIRTIEAEIVPRLVLTRRVSVAPSAARAEMAKIPDFGDVKELVRLLLVEGRIQKSPEGVVHLMAEKLSDRTDELDRLSEDKVRPDLSRADGPTHGEGPDTRPRQSHGRHPRNVRVLPKSRDFH